MQGRRLSLLAKERRQESRIDIVWPRAGGGGDV